MEHVQEFNSSRNNRLASNLHQSRREQRMHRRFGSDQLLTAADAVG